MGSGRGCLPGRETWEGFGVTWHLFATQGAAGRLRRGLRVWCGCCQAHCPALPFSWRDWTSSLSAHINRAALWCSLCAHTSMRYYENKYLGLNFRINVPVDVKNMNCFLFCFVWRGSSRKDLVFASFLLDVWLEVFILTSYNTEEMQVRTGIYLISKLRQMPCLRNLF